jgi:hypothetical protein
MLRTAAAILSLTVVSMPAYAGQQSADLAADTQSAALTADSLSAVTPVATAGKITLNVSVTHEPTARPAALPPLYGSYVAFQLFDGYQTIRGIGLGGHETNPLMTGIAGSPAAVWTIKAASAVMAITAAERMWKTNKKGAIAVMIIGNGLSAAVAARNASVLKNLR